MKIFPFDRHSFFFAIVLALFVAECSASLKFETREIDLTINAEQHKAVAAFRFKNMGSNPVFIRAVRPNCDCTTAAPSRKNYDVGEAGEINVVFNFRGHVGPQEKQIEVETDDAPSKAFTLTLRVNITEPISCSSHLMEWKLSENKDEQFVTIESIGLRKIRSLVIQPNFPPEVAAHIEPQNTNGNFRLFARPVSFEKPIGVLIPCEVTFIDGTKYSFVVSALAR